MSHLLIPGSYIFGEPSLYPLQEKLPLLYFLQEIWRIGFIPSLKVWQDSAVNTSETSALCFGKFLIIDSISLIEFYSVYFSLCASWDCVTLKRLTHVIYVIKFMGTELFIVLIYNSFNVSEINSDKHFFMSDEQLHLKSFSLGQLSLGFITFMNLFKEPTFGLIYFLC